MLSNYEIDTYLGIFKLYLSAFSIICGDTTGFAVVSGRIFAWQCVAVV